MILESSCFYLCEWKQPIRTTAFVRTINQIPREHFTLNRTDYIVRYHLVFQAEGKRSDGIVKQHTFRET